MPRTNYSIAKRTEKYVFIYVFIKNHCGDDPNAMSVTNAAESVVVQLAGQIVNKRLLYMDSDGRIDELLHENGQFVDFKLLDQNDPNEVPSELFEE